MPDPVVVPSIAMLTGTGLIAHDYFKKRLNSTEDRYMTLYGQKDWQGSNMDLRIRCAPKDKPSLVRHFLDRLEHRLHLGEADAAFYREEVRFKKSRLHIERHPTIKLKDLLEPRQGAYIDLDDPAGIRLVWNHLQSDGVGMWNAVRPLFDPNPPLIPYRSVPPPPPLVPELLALPSVAQRLAWRSQLKQELPAKTTLTRGFSCWSAAHIREIKTSIGCTFNILTSALTIQEVFYRHPHREQLNVGLTAYFPFLQGRNKYGIFLCKVRRDHLPGLTEQLTRQTRSQLLNWGRSAAQAYALSRLPNRLFAQLVNYYRRQVDVLVSSLPVGREPISLGGVPTTISCHPWQLTLPYYFLLIGTRHELHVSYTSRFAQNKDRFAQLPESPPASSPSFGRLAAEAARYVAQA
ncbi:MAG: hypothetical protein KTR25_09995 [Myxococcales bacterium]|nr:hypothetical protein [Myxococcales bacterium]